VRTSFVRASTSAFDSASTPATGIGEPNVTTTRVRYPTA